MGLHSAIKMLQQQLITLQQLMARVNSGESPATSSSVKGRVICISFTSPPPVPLTHVTAR